MLLNISYLLKVLGGEGGIRTHGTLARTTVFETAPIDHSGTSPSDRRPRNFRGREWRGAVIQHRLPPANPAAARASGPCHVDAREPHGACRRRACGVVRNRPPRCSKEVSHAEPSRPKITISSAMSRLIARAFSAGLAGITVDPIWAVRRVHDTANRERTTDLRLAFELHRRASGSEPSNVPRLLIIGLRGPAA
jgi:hypothetical protein